MPLLTRRIEAYSSPETAHAIARLALRHQPHVLFDIGCGTGDIALMVARERPECEVTGVDIDVGCIQIADQDAPRNATFIVGDLYEALVGVGDVICITVPWEPASAYPEAPVPRIAYIDDSSVYARALLGAHDYLDHDGVVLVYGPVGFDAVMQAAGWSVDARFRNAEGNAIYACR